MDLFHLSDWHDGFLTGLAVTLVVVSVILLMVLILPL